MSKLHKRPRLEEEGADVDGRDEEYGMSQQTTRSCIILHYNNKSFPLCFSRGSSPQSLESAVRAVCSLGVRNSFYLKNDKGEICVVDASLPQGNYFIHVATCAIDMSFRLPFVGVRNLEKLRECVMTSYCFILHELPAELHQYMFTFLAPSDLLNASKVCKMWYNVSNDPELWRRLYAQRFLVPSTIPDPPQALARLGWKNVYFVGHLFGVSTRDIRMQVVNSLKTLLEKSLLETDDENYQSMTILAGLERFVIIVFVHFPLVPFRTNNGMLTFQLALPSTTVQVSYPFNLWSWRTSAAGMAQKCTAADLTTRFFKPFLDDSLVQVKRMIEGGAREKMMFSKHTLPVFIPLPPTCAAPRTTREKIIVCVDLSTPDRNPFVGQRCASDVTLLEVVKFGVKTFVDVKHKMNNSNQFAICALGETAEMHQPFTNNVEEFSSRLDELIPCGKLRTFDMSSLFSTMSNFIEQDAKNGADKDCVYRCIFIYCRSDSVPIWTHGQQSGRKVLSRENFFFDVLYLHEKPSSSNMPQEVFDALTDVYHTCGTMERPNSSYYCENSTSISRHFLCWAQIMAMPSQRPQQVENLPIVPYPEVAINIGKN
jgi:hypothetical protein